MRKGTRIENAVTRLSGALIHIGIMSDLSDRGYTLDDARIYMTGFNAGLTWERRDALKWGCAQMRQNHPEAKTVDVRVKLADGLHDFTWDEFDAWTV